MSKRNDECSIALLIMAKNEEKYILKSLTSCLGVISSVVLHDTGSTDNTIQVTKEFCESNQISFHLTESEFVDFSTNRNRMHEFADTITPGVDFYILLDANDELKHGEVLKKELTKHVNDKNIQGFYTPQEWLYRGETTHFLNIRCVRSKSDFRYAGVVHEYIHSPSGAGTIHFSKEVCIIFQNRDSGSESSYKRFERDVEMLLKEHQANPADARTVFYLAQSYRSLGNHQEAYYYYKLRPQLTGFVEEAFLSYFRCGRIAERFGLPWEVPMGWYMKAYEMRRRLEPLYYIALHYDYWKMYDIAEMYIHKAIQLPFPDNDLLFVEAYIYRSEIWKLAARVYKHLGRRKDALDCAKKLPPGPEKERILEDIIETFLPEEEKIKRELKKIKDKKKMMDELEKDSSPNNQGPNNQETISQDTELPAISCTPTGPLKQ
jgi:glycosyltransferase involved in cell wall biosynthesis